MRIAVAMRSHAVGIGCREPESFCPALARSLGRMTQAVYIILTSGPEIGSNAPREACRPPARKGAMRPTPASWGSCVGRT